MIKCALEVSKTETNKQIKKYKDSMKWRIGSLKKINKIDKPLASFAKRHSKKIQISKIRD